MRNQNASVEQKVREADHKLRLREKELLDLQVGYVLRLLVQYNYDNLIVLLTFSLVSVFRSGVNASFEMYINISDKLGKPFLRAIASTGCHVSAYHPLLYTATIL